MDHITDSVYPTARKEANSMSLKDPNVANAKRRKRVAIVLANPAQSTTTGWPVGFWWSELTHSYFVFTEQGYEVELFSPRGGRCDERSPRPQRILVERPHHHGVHRDAQAGGSRRDHATGGGDRRLEVRCRRRRGRPGADVHVRIGRRPAQEVRRVLPGRQDRL